MLPCLLLALADLAVVVFGLLFGWVSTWTQDGRSLKADCLAALFGVCSDVAGEAVEASKTELPALAILAILSAAVTISRAPPTPSLNRPHPHPEIYFSCLSF